MRQSVLSLDNNCLLLPQHVGGGSTGTIVRLGCGCYIQNAVVVEPRPLLREVGITEPAKLKEGGMGTSKIPVVRKGKSCAGLGGAGGFWLWLFWSYPTRPFFAILDLLPLILLILVEEEECA